MNPRTRLWLVALGGAGLAALLVAACLRLPVFGGARHPYGDRAVRASLSRHTANTVASVNFDQRAFDGHDPDTPETRHEMILGA